MPSPRLTPKAARLLAFQCFATLGALVLLLLFVLYNTRPNHVGTTGGIDPTNTTIVWIAWTVVSFALCYIQFNFARQLLGEAKGVRRGVESW